MLTVIGGGRPLTKSIPSHAAHEKEPPVLRLLGEAPASPGGPFMGTDAGVLEWAPRKLGGGVLHEPGLDWWGLFVWFAVLAFCGIAWNWIITGLARLLGAR